ncbi:unnamed protein product [Camellia sinensis]
MKSHGTALLRRSSSRLLATGASIHHLVGHRCLRSITHGSSIGGSSLTKSDFNMQVSTYSMLLTLNIFNSKLVLASPETAIDADYAAILGVIGHEAEDLQNMFQMASSLKGKDSNGLGSDTKSKPAKDWETFAVRGDHAGENSSSHGSFSNSKTTPQLSFLNPTADVQEQMKSQMKDPALWQMFTSIIKNMSPDMMANMGEQFGFKLSQEDAEKAQQAMSSLSPDDLDKMDYCWELFVSAASDTAVCIARTVNPAGVVQLAAAAAVAGAAGCRWLLLATDWCCWLWLVLLLFGCLLCWEIILL